MKHHVTVLLSMLLASFVCAAETAPVVESFGCTLKPGKTLADWQAANTFGQSQVAGIAALDTYAAGYLQGAVGALQAKDPAFGQFSTSQ